MGSTLPSANAAPGAGVDQLAQCRRERFVTTFQTQCEEILGLIDKVEGRRGRTAPLKLRQRVQRLRALAQIAGFDGVATGATALEGVVSATSFDAALARDVVARLADALESDIAADAPAPPEPARAEATPLRILLVDDHAVLRGGIRAFLANRIHGATFGEADDGAHALDLLRRRPWDVVLLDISLGGRTGLDLLKDIKAEWPRLPVLMLSAHREDEVALRALRAGAAGYMTKQCAPDELVPAMQKVAAGGRYVSAALADYLAAELRYDHDRLPHQTLSDREYDVMCRIAQGKTVGEIAAAMALSVKTISTYRTRVLDKLRLRNNAEIVQYAVKNRLVC